MYLSIRTDKPEAEIGLFEGQRRIDYIIWEANRELSQTIHQKIDKLLSAQGRTLSNLSKLEGIVVFEGPGSFTGLRIGLSVANALASGLSIPIASARSDDWTAKAIDLLIQGKGQTMALPFYGQLPKITKPRK